MPNGLDHQRTSWLPGTVSDRSRAAALLDERQRALEFAVPRPLGEVTGDDDGRGRQLGNLALERCHLGQVGVGAEVAGHSGGRAGSAHQTTRTR